MHRFAATTCKSVLMDAACRAKTNSLHGVDLVLFRYHILNYTWCMVTLIINGLFYFVMINPQGGNKIWTTYAGNGWRGGELPPAN